MMNKNLIRFSKCVFEKNKFRIFISFFLVILVAALELVIPQLTKRILDDGITKGNMNLLTKLIIIYFIISTLNPLIQLVLEYLYTVMKNKVTISLKVKLLNHLSCLSGRYFSEIKSGNLLSIINQDMFIIENFNVELLFNMITNVFTAIFSMIFLINMSKDLLLIVILIELILVFIQSKMRRHISNKTTNIRKANGNLFNIIQEYVSNIKNIVISKSKLKFFKSYIKKERDLMNNMLKLNLIIVGNMSITKILNSAIIVTIYGYGGYKIIKGQFSIGELIAFQQYTNMLIGPCMNIIKSANQIAQAKVSIDRVYSVIDEPIDIKVENSAFKISQIDVDRVELKNVYFDYVESNKENNVLKNLNMIFKKGETTAIVGESGCGKSTIISLLYRLWDVTDGEILIDDLNIKNINLKSLRSNVHIVNQDVFLFDDTIKNNIDFREKFSYEEILKICNIVGLDNLLKSLENGIDTVIGEKGVKISGGQKQRIQIARAIISSSKIIILDEATSALDNISQNNILNNINKYIKDKIVIVIAHRLSTIKDANNIYVLEKGQVIESGSDKDLSAEGGLYKVLITASD
ncbi:ABC transporter ATP-binding protein [Clostridioides sp. ZZV13-5731]|nr:ABC transporter ATP-binding protein [Clostridioides sp. ZZV14-6150]MCC0723351.1 ABC transporter ATP-binding protein [Clostridioides sp. ZZV14-6104]MCC0742768.1 ABC transporter ATP-binding protein [Clostridioides sp. ZZV14-6044]MCC0751277.1 ABC transporter ATP-binding protein [Clostridioides sp. ZZV13-5731]